MIYCAFCKKQIEDDALFCPYCGKSAPQGDALAELAAAARTGDQDAIGALYEKTYSKVYYTVQSMIRDEDAVFDIVQDTYIKAFTHLDSFQGDTKFLPWVRQIAANTARDWLKKKRPMLFAELGSGDGQDTPVEEQFPDERSDNLPDQIIDQKETKRLIREIIEELPEDQRAVIGMFYYEEMSVKEIAAVMGVSESAVKSRLMYGRNKIEKKVLELEKRGTKLYSLSPLPFLLLLFRSQKAYACEAPDGRILDSILALRPMGSAAAAGAAATKAAADAGTAGAGAAGTGGAGAGAAGTAGAGTAGAGGVGTAAAAGGLGALKIGLIAFAAAAVVGAGAFGAAQLASSSEPQELPAGNPVGQQASAAPVETEAPAAPEEPEAPAETEAPSLFTSYIFSEMPFAAYEVTGLGVGLNEETYAEHVFDPIYEQDRGIVPFVKLDSSNTFVLFCMRNGIIRSSSGSSLWEANEYYRTEELSHPASYTYPEIEGYASGSNYFVRAQKAYHEAESDGGMYDSMQPDLFKFFEIYHPDAPQEDTIYVIIPLPDYYGDAEAQEDIVNRLKYIGATNVQEISVEEALKKSHITVSEEDMTASVFSGPVNEHECTSYVIPDGVRSIGKHTFLNCYALTSIEIPNSVKGIGSWAFRNCDALPSIEIPNSVTWIGAYAFAECHRLTSIEIPDSVRVIAPGAFSSCYDLTSIEIPDGVTWIGAGAFSDCRSLNNIEIPNSVTKIGAGAFRGCIALKTIKVPEGLDVSNCGLGENVQVIHTGMPSVPQETEILSTPAGEVVFIGPEDRNCTSYVIPDGVTEIDERAFVKCRFLTSVKIPNSVKKIGDYAFEGCMSLTDIEIPSSVTEIGNEAFAECSSLTSVEILGGVTKIGERTFAECPSLTSVEIPNSVTKIGDYAFEGCKSLTDIEIPSSVTEIGSGAFEGCRSLTDIEIPGSVRSIGYEVFAECRSLTSIEIPEGVTEIKSSLFWRCRGLTSIKIPNSVTEIGIYAFQGCESLTSIEIPNSVTVIGNSAFQDCRALKTIKVPQGLDVSKCGLGGDVQIIYY